MLVVVANLAAEQRRKQFGIPRVGVMKAGHRWSTRVQPRGAG
jgi:hypothetical protein